MNEDDILKDPDAEELIPDEVVEDDELDLEGVAKKKKDLIDPDTESLDDLEEAELEDDEEEEEVYEDRDLM